VPEGQMQKIKRVGQVFTQIDKNTGDARKDTLQSTPVDKFYTVKQGDTLYNISKRFGLTVDNLKALNNLTDSSIKIGEKLVVVK
jgi:LysM repeat protein